MIDQEDALMFALEQANKLQNQLTLNNWKMNKDGFTARLEVLAEFMTFEGPIAQDIRKRIAIMLIDGFCEKLNAENALSAGALGKDKLQESIKVMLTADGMTNALLQQAQHYIELERHVAPLSANTVAKSRFSELDTAKPTPKSKP